MWFWLAIASAVLGAIEIILSKKILHKVSSSVLAWATFTLSIPPLFALSLKDGIPSVNMIFYIGVFGSSLAFVFAKTIGNRSLKQNLISKIMPLAAFSGIFTYIFGLIFLSETIRLIPVIGLISVVLGSYILNVDQAKEDFLKPFKIVFATKTSLFFLIAVMLGSLTAVLDKLGLINTTPKNPVFILLIEQIIMSVMLMPYLLRNKSKTWIKELRNNFGGLFLISIIFLLTGLLILYAYTDGPVALIIGVKRLQIIFILLMGYLFFKDKPTKHIWIATFIMILGVLMIRLG